MTLDKTKDLIQHSIDTWESISPNKLTDMDDILNELLDDGLDYENICYFLLNIIYK